MSAKSDSQLIETAIAGDEKAYSLLYNKYYKRLRAFVRGIVHDQNYVEDVVQETFAQSFRYLSSFRGDCTFFTWMCTIAKNTVYKMKTQVFNSNVSFIEQDTPESNTNNGQIVEAWLADMTDIQRMAVTLHYVNGLTAKEITSIIPMKRHAVSTLLWRAKQKLKGMLYDE